MTSPSAERWSRIEALLDRALDLPATEREAFLRAECAANDTLVTEVLGLIEAGENPRILAGDSATALAADLIREMSADSPVADRLPERMIGPFRLIAKLGEGGMGTVYLAEREAHFAQRVAVKLIRPGLHLDRELVRRFVDERQMLASLDHPGIARLLDGGVTDDGLPWFAMELVDGEPADRYCDGRRLTIETRLELFGTICDAVDYAHRRGIVHRDLKPSNILVRADGSVKLLDFGVAKLLAPNVGSVERRTRTGARLLTPEFASPEQIRGLEVTPASDVYALGLLLYELLTGQRPYRPAGRSLHDIERAVVDQQPVRPSDAAHEEPAPGTGLPSAAERARLRRTTPGALGDRLRGSLDEIVLAALAKEPGDRYAMAGALGDAIGRRGDAGTAPVRGQQGSAASSRTDRGPRRRAAFTAIIGILVLSALGVWTVTRPSHSAPDGSPRREAGDTAPVLAVGLITDYRLTDTPGVARSLADLLATNLARLSAIRTVSTARLYELMAQRGKSGSTDAGAYSAAARSAGATAMIDGSVYATDDGTLRLDLRLVDLATGEVQSARTVTGSNIFALVDSGTAGVASQLGATRPGGSVADVTSRSEVAYRFYEEGMRAFYRGDVRAARGLFETSVAEDSSFAMAYYYLAVSTPNPEHSRQHMERALRLAARATDRERMFIETVTMLLFADPRAVAKADSFARRYPEELAGQVFAAQARFTAGDLAGALGLLRPLVAADSAVAPNANARCTVCDARSLYTSVLVFADSLAAAEREMRRWTALEPNRAAPWVSLSTVLEVRGDTTGAREAYRRAVGIDPARQGTPDYYAYHDMRRGDYETADRALGELVRTGSPERQTDAYWYLAISLREQGRLAEAMRAVQAHYALITSVNSDVPAAQFLLARAQALFETGRYRESVALFDSTGRAYAGWPASFQARYRTWSLGLSANPLVALRDTAELTARADSTQRYGAMSLLARDQRMHHYLRGLLLAMRGDDDAAIDEYRRAMTWSGYGYTRIDFELGRALLRRGRAREAAAALGPASREFESTNLYVTRTEVRELLARAWDAAGVSDSAVAHYRAVARAWQRADPVLRPRLDSVRARLAVLERRR